MSSELSFENSLKRLDEIITKLNSAGIPLEEAMELYTESAVLIQHCNGTLNDAKLKIEEVYPTVSSGE